MKELFLIRDTLANKISYYHLMLYLLSLPFDRFFSHLILISFSVHTIIQITRSNIRPVFTLRTLALQSVFWVTAVSTIYSINRQQAFKEWELYIPVLLFPLLFCFNTLDLKKYRPQLLLAFSIGCTATILYLYWDAFATIRYYKMPFSSILSPAFTNHNFSEPIDMHATFFSLQVVIALVYLLSEMIKKQKRSGQIFYSLCCAILAAGIIQLSSKSIFVALFLIVNIAFPFFLPEGGGRRKFILIALFISALVGAGIFNSNSFRARFLTELQQDLSRPTTGETTDPRLARWGIAAGLIGESPVIGHGAGSEIQLLREKYFAKKFYRSYLNRLNAHNEYLSFLIKSGIWGLIAFVITLAYGFKKAVLKKDLVFFSFMLLLAIVSISENVLDADKGVMYYSFFLSFFVFIADQKEQPAIPVKKHKYLNKMATNLPLVPSSL